MSPRIDHARTSIMSFQRTCYIHAGTHKTASSYIQSRLSQNCALLATHNLLYEFPGPSKLKHKPLVRAANRNSWECWISYLKRYQNIKHDLLLSAEQFTLTLCNRARLDEIRRMLAGHGFKLQVIIFVRPQLDYMNSRYVYGLRCLHYSLKLEEYVVESFNRKTGDFYDYWTFYEPLREAGVGCTFLPFHRCYGDPFLQLMDALGLEMNHNFAPGAPGRDNVQHGMRGVWLSRLVVKKLEKLGFSGHDLKRSSRVMRRICEREGWHEERYFGFSDDLAATVLTHYHQGNDAFARWAWDRSWQEVFPQETARQCVYCPRNLKEQQKMQKLADHVIGELASKNEQLAQALRASP
ncbi:MAG: hypothetical protein WBN89_05480 [Prochlorococcaceae cyanobacterium]